MAWRARFQALLTSARAEQRRAKERRAMDEREAQRRLYPQGDRVDRKKANGV